MSEQGPCSHCACVSRLRERVEVLADAHRQHRSSDQHFLRSLGLLTESHEKLTAKLANIESQLAKQADHLQRLVAVEELRNDG